MTRLVLAFAVTLTAAVGSLRAQDFVDVKGRFVFDGKAPTLAPLVGKGAATKDPTICAAEGAIPDQSLVVDEKGGIANVFIYLREAPATIDPKQAAVPAKRVLFDQKGCVFTPHAMFVRAGQGVDVSSMDACAHNTHTFPIKNKAVNFLLPPNPPQPTPVDTPESEILPITVKCDIHPWMTAYWLILDHPYAAVSKEDGTFEIKGLPVGQHSFRVWHEKAGYLDRGLKITVTASNEPLAVDEKETTYEAKDFD